MTNPLKAGYERIWVPLFGRMLMKLSTLIEGKQPQQKPTYDLRTKNKGSLINK